MNLDVKPMTGISSALSEEEENEQRIRTCSENIASLFKHREARWRENSDYIRLNDLMHLNFSIPHDVTNILKIHQYLLIFYYFILTCMVWYVIPSKSGFIVLLLVTPIIFVLIYHIFVWDLGLQSKVLGLSNAMK